MTKVLFNSESFLLKFPCTFPQNMQINFLLNIQKNIVSRLFFFFLWKKFILLISIRQRKKNEIKCEHLKELIKFRNRYALIIRVLFRFSFKLKFYSNFHKTFWIHIYRLIPQAFMLGIGMRRCPLSRCIISITPIPGNQDASRVAVATILRFGSASYATDSTPNIALISCTN